MNTGQQQSSSTNINIGSTPSFKIGNTLGKMARLFIFIKKETAFLKDIAGRLTRNTTHLSGVVKYSVQLLEKAIEHDKVSDELKEEVVGTFKMLANMEEKEYKPSYFSLGFFEAFHDYKALIKQKSNPLESPIKGPIS